MVAKTALLQLLKPIADFVFDSGFSTSELHAIFLEAAVRSTAARQLEVFNRVNISGIAATTGIPRAEISRILNGAGPAAKKKSRKTQLQSTGKILTAWHEDPKFIGPGGRPLELKIYGGPGTFEALAAQYSHGLPTRAVLDELIRIGSVELYAGQKVRPKSCVPVERRIRANAIKTFGDRVAKLVTFLLVNLNRADSQKFIADVWNDSIVPSSLPLLRRDLSIKSADFLAYVQGTLNRNTGTRISKRKTRSLAKVGLTVFYCESCDVGNVTQRTARKRLNFRR